MEKKNADGPLSQEQQIDAIVNSNPWIALLGQKDSNARKILKGCSATFNKHKKVLMRTLSSLSNLEAPVDCMMTYFNNDDEIALAVTIQNCMHPKMSQRSDAVKNATYLEIETIE